MSRRIVFDGENGWLNLRAMAINWWEEAGQGDPVGSIKTQLRWMIHPSIGLPLSHFQVWRMPLPSSSFTKHALANEGDWELLETVGLPITDDWMDTPYSREPQGLIGALFGPREAAFARLDRGAPQRGWPVVTVDGRTLPKWQRPNDDAFLEQLRASRIMTGLHQMLVSEPSPRKHKDFFVSVDRSDPSELLPHLLLNDSIGTIDGNEQPRGKWRPLSLMAMSAGSDPLAALGFGFGTALDTASEGDELYMVTVRHELEPSYELELADIARATLMYDRVPNPSGLGTSLSKVTRAQQFDGPTMETIAVSWARPVKPILMPLATEVPFPVSYAIGRFGWPPIDLLLTRRPEDVRGWLSYVPSASRDDEPIFFNDHIFRTGDGTASGSPYPLDYSVTYVVAGQDIFGRWSDWEQVAFTSPMEGPQGPSVVSVQLDNNNGVLTVEFSWDWANRSPEFVELSGAWVDDPGNVLTSARIDFEGQDQGQTGANIVPLSTEKKPSNWGSEQDKLEPGIRLYRWTTTAPLSFNGARWREFGVQARGQRRLHHLEFGGNTTWNTSPWSTPVVTRVWENVQLDPPFVEPPEAPFWASLPDAAGVSRFTLGWPSVPNAAGYIVYEATETALLSANNMTGPDTAVAHYVRLGALRNADIRGVQRTFRRLTEEPVTQTSYEVTLPRGSRVIHFFAITTMSSNKLEGHWPNDNQMFVAVAVPRLNVPPTPGISVATATGAPQQVAVTIDLNGGAGSRIELYRTNVANAAKEVGSMGPAIGSLNAAGGTALFTDTGATPGWYPHHYRAVAWSGRDDLLGLVEARSAASQAVSILVPPPAAPGIGYLGANEPYSTATECLIAWNSYAPRRRTLVGPHITVIEVRSGEDTIVSQRIERELESTTRIESLLEMPGPSTDRIFAFQDGNLWHYRAWIPRTADEEFFLTVKVIDPLGRIARKTIAVGPLAPNQQWITIPPWPDKEHVEYGDDMGLEILGAHHLGLRVVYEYARFEPGYEHEQVVSISPPAGTVVAAGSTVTILINLLG
ncbi:PASTA domain-containing protein [Mesorhizobium sp.]|uniref:PASTA domain-containing protein n=1 Tax=Mesorhizobium sp. TaxID=1871066 RepID=UPI000FE50FEC|nr:PASTA domain-containing protein [Mesorhizobium sp.]RWP30699.1 MAG: hypothetical protein EOR03_24265 [Mesorhizobium sp.]